MKDFTVFSSAGLLLRYGTAPAADFNNQVFGDEVVIEGLWEGHHLVDGVPVSD